VMFILPPDYGLSPLGQPSAAAVQQTQRNKHNAANTAQPPPLSCASPLRPALRRAAPGLPLLGVRTLFDVLGARSRRN
jgi:hypothetical protein